MKLWAIENRRMYFTISGIAFILSAFMIFFWNLNLWIDMTWGTQSEFWYETYEYNSENVWTVAQWVMDEINTQWNIISTVSSYKISWENAFVVEAWFSNNIETKELDAYKIQFRDTLEDTFSSQGDVVLTKYTNIGASFGEYIKNTARLTLFLAIVAIAIYIAYAFSGSAGWISSLGFAGITLITLFHDVVISSGLYILVSSFIPHFQIDTFFITALLTILWYSINDTIVVFDRIRSNLKEFGWKSKDLKEIISDSISQSITRSIYTSLTLAFVLVCVLLLWPDSISGFTLTMLFGTIIGTFSSIFIASPLLYEFHKNVVLTEYVKKDDYSEEDKLVV